MKQSTQAPRLRLEVFNGPKDFLLRMEDFAYPWFEKRMNIFNKEGNFCQISRKKERSLHVVLKTFSGNLMLSA